MTEQPAAVVDVDEGERAAARDAVSRPAWELENELAGALDMLNDAYDPETGEPTDPPVFVLELVEQTLAAAREKRDALGGAVRRYEALQAVLEERAADAKLKAQRVANTIRRLKTYVLSVMEATGVDRIEGYQYKLARQRNPASVECVPIEQVPVAMAGHTRRKEVVEWDKAAIKADLHCGVVVDYAKLKPGDWRLVIR